MQNLTMTSFMKDGLIDFLLGRIFILVARIQMKMCDYQGIVSV